MNSPRQKMAKQRFICQYYF